VVAGLGGKTLLTWEDNDARRNAIQSLAKKLEKALLCRCTCQDLSPAAGRSGLSVWPPSTLALPPQSVSEGTRAMGEMATRATNGLAKRGPQEEWQAFARIA
jgi:hypothetical protein